MHFLIKTLAIQTDPGESTSAYADKNGNDFRLTTPTQCACTDVGLSFFRIRSSLYLIESFDSAFNRVGLLINRFDAPWMHGERYVALRYVTGLCRRIVTDDAMESRDRSLSRPMGTVTFNVNGSDARSSGATSLILRPNDSICWPRNGG